MKNAQIAGSYLIASMLIGSPAAMAASPGKQTLADLLTPVFLAQNVATVCASREPRFLSDLGGLTAINTFVEHSKRHVIEGLRAEEEERVLFEAAGRARDTARSLIRKFEDPSPVVEAQRLDEWCRTSASALVITAISDHDTNHDVFVRSILEGRREP
jgi:hypothetical protein